MTKVTYTPSDNPEHAMPRTTSQYGIEFEAGVPVEVAKPEHVMKFQGNPWFVVGEASPAAAAAPHELEAKHVGGGKYAVMRGDERASDTLMSKEEAEAFNTWPDADRAAYIAKPE